MINRSKSKGTARILAVAASCAAVATLSQAANKLTGPPFAVDHQSVYASQASFNGETSGTQWVAEQAGLTLAPSHNEGTYISPVEKAPFRFTELLPSWNVDLDEKTQGYRLEVRVRDEAGKNWSPWFYFGSAGTLLETSHTSVQKDEAWGEVDVDYLMLKQPATAHQARFTLTADSTSTAPPPALQRYYITVSNVEGDEQLHRRMQAKKPALKPDDGITTLSIPYRSQKWVNDRRLAGQICCPTSIAMILESHGIDIGTSESSANSYDVENQIYGNWPRAAQSVVRWGLASRVQRFRDTSDVRRILATGNPLMASIRAKKGEFTSIPDRATAGHLILIRGVTPAMEYVVNDPSHAGPQGEEVVYSEQEMKNVWFDKGGVGIVIWDPAKMKRTERDGK
ncbi:hypothetical protein CVU37_07395 [candidate division BRC1 bacterium HGW-BRC1-1]|jgi:hypothetical protein|nr:MAG: hypothetical protein CVU37_07395 [candidate division BRC1 bacterium HGW-BRC1-1]